MTAPIRRATSLRPGQFKHLIRVASVTGRLPERDVMLLWLTHTPLGFASPNWPYWRSQTCCTPAEPSSPRCIYEQTCAKGLPGPAQCVPDTCSMPCGPGRLDGFKIAVRLRRRWAFPALTNTGACAQVQSWLPHTRAKPELAFKHRELNSGSEVYRACDSLQQAISRLYRQTGIKQGASHSGRRSLAAKVLAATGDVETVQHTFLAIPASITASRI